MTPPSNAGGEGREVLAREVLAEVGIEVGFGGTMIWRGNVVTGTAVIAAMLAFSDREHATPRSMPEEVVEGCRHHVHVDDSLAFADQISEQHRLRANAAEARLRLIIDTLIDKGESWQSYADRLRAIAWEAFPRHQSGGAA